MAFLFSMIGYYPYFIIVQKHIQYQVRNQIRKNVGKEELIEISYDKRKNEKPKWIRRDKELIYCGKYYDVVSLETKDEKSIFRCIDDKKETRLVNLFMGFAKNRLRDISNTFLNNFKRAQILEDDEQDGCCLSSKSIKLVILDSSLQTRVVEFDTPPPKA